MNADFQVPGSTTPALVRGFGVVFVDVDQQGSATLEFFGPSGSLGRFEAPVGARPGGTPEGFPFPWGLLGRAGLHQGALPRPPVRQLGPPVRLPDLFGGVQKSGIQADLLGQLEVLAEHASEFREV